MSVRPATLEDVPAIARVHVSSWQTSYRHLLPDEFLGGLDEAVREHKARRALENAEAVNFVAEQGGEVVGFARGGPIYTNFPGFSGELYALYTLERVQGQGLGRSLFEAVRGALLERGHSSLMLWVLAENPARGFYERMGGQPTGQTQEIEVGGVKLLEVAYGWSG